MLLPFSLPPNRFLRSIKLLNDVDLNAGAGDEDPMMIVAFGKSFTVSDSAPKKMIMNALARAAIERDRAQEEEDAGGAGATSARLLGEARTLPRPSACASPAMSAKQVAFDAGQRYV